MATLVIRQKKSKFALKIPHKIFINNQLVGIMNTRELNIHLPEGCYTLTIGSMIPYIYAKANVHPQEHYTHVVEFGDKEKWWDILFCIDMILWIADCFFSLPHPWNIAYKIFTNGYFIFWLIYEWSIRKHYFMLTQYHTPVSPIQ